MFSRNKRGLARSQQGFNVALHVKEIDLTCRHAPLLGISRTIGQA